MRRERIAAILAAGCLLTGVLAPAGFVPKQVVSVDTASLGMLPKSAKPYQGKIILALDRMYAGYPEDRAEYLKKYRAGCITTGHQVQLITPAARRQAFALEIDDDFNLVVEHYNGKRETISAGEVSVRGMYGYV